MALKINDFDSIRVVIASDDTTQEDIENAFHTMMQIVEEKVGTKVASEDKESYDYFLKVMEIYAMNNTYGTKKLLAEVTDRTPLLEALKGDSISLVEKRVVLKGFVNELTDGSVDFEEDVEAFDGAIDFIT